MRRVAFKMKLKAGFEDEYKKRHDQIWPQLAQELSRNGVHDYSIFFDRETSTLFAVQKLAENNTADKLPQSVIVRKWWDFMSDIMEVNPDNSPVVFELSEKFSIKFNFLKLQR